jgi:hypothetical protein
MENSSKFPRFEKEPRKFNWRDYLQHPEALSEESATTLNTLIEMLETDPEAEQFFGPLHLGQYKSQTVPAFVNFFRNVLEPEERARLLREIYASGPTDYVGGLD